MPKQTTIIDSSFPNSSSPRLSRSEIIHSILSNLNHNDSITRCNINCATITKDLGNRLLSKARRESRSGLVPVLPADLGLEPITSLSELESADRKSPTKDAKLTVRLNRSKINSSTLINASLRRSDVTRCTLSNIPRGRSLIATDSILDAVTPLRRVTASNSTASDGSALARSALAESILSHSAIYRSVLQRSHVMDSRVKKSKLVDCQVSNCVIINCDFKGMVLKDGVWRSGTFLGPVGEKGKKGHGGRGEVEGVLFGGEKLGKPVKSEKSQGPQEWMEELASETENSDRDDSESEEEDGKDLPPPYTP
ncbi:uncharacterized protein BDV17DRAFT_81282 [Aspergillus undulatus]|uniref:uncharacterized protein n=1 Tax=Aspergillus undulatus TaxID=1810928 RepID=UPI003CCDEC26